jgi:pimeloyl-ACP methyl ester carboxylesterase
VAAFLYPAAAVRFRFRDLPGGEPVLVFIHGLGASATQGFAAAVQLSPLSGHRRLLIDLLGFGESEAPTGFSYSIEDHATSIVALLDELRLRGVTLVGHSMGGAIAIVIARTRPDLASRLVLVEAHLDPQVGSISGATLATSEAEFARAGREGLARKLEADGLASYAAAVRAANPVGMHRSARSLVAQRSPTFREMLVDLSLPRTFLIGGRHADDPDIRWLPAHGVPVTLIPDAGHEIMNDQPTAFAAAVGSILGA